MASITADSGGRRRILFVAPDGVRKTIRLGKCDRKAAESICRHVEALLASRLSGQPLRAETAAWLGSIGDTLRDKLARAGLIASERSRALADVTLGEFLTGYLQERPDVAAATQTILKQAARHLLAALGKDAKLRDLTPADGDRFRAWLVSRGCARSTIAKWCRYAKHFLAVAVRRKLIAENPLGHLKGKVVGDPARRKFIPAEEVRAVLEVIPCPQWRALVVLARWGGLRIPSEALALRWSDVLWDRGLFIVRASKTAHHEDGGVRLVPLFPEVRAALDELWQLAPEGADHVLTRFTGTAQNLRTQLARYCERAGVKPWIKPFQNMRVSRATELADQYPSHVCAAWLGHTERIADAFYRQVTDEHVQRAVSGPSVLAALGLEGVAQKAAQHTAARSSTEQKNITQPGVFSNSIPQFAPPCKAMQPPSLGGRRLERRTSTL